MGLSVLDAIRYPRVCWVPVQCVVEWRPKVPRLEPAGPPRVSRKSPTFTQVDIRG